MKNFKKIIYSFLVMMVFVLPVVSFAQSPVVTNTNACTLPSNIKFGDLLNFITCNISTSVVPLIFVLAMAAFIWGVVNFLILGAEEESKREKGKQFMIWGIVALAVMVSVWGLVKVVTNTFGVKNVIPQLQTQ